MTDSSGLFDKLRTAAQEIDPSLQVSNNEVTGIVSALMYFAEHGDEFLKAAEGGVHDIVDLVHPAPKTTDNADTTAGAELTPEQASHLAAQLEAFNKAQSQRTQVQHDTGDTGTPSVVATSGDHAPDESPQVSSPTPTGDAPSEPQQESGN